MFQGFKIDGIAATRVLDERRVALQRQACMTQCTAAISIQS